MYVTGADHKIAVYGMHKMVLTDWDGTRVVVMAVRHGDGWEVSSPGEPETVTQHGTRREAIEAMIDTALEVEPGEGFSTFEPHVAIGDDLFSLRDLP